jgi:nucleotide-binding universal stress UspA family protein
MAYKTILLSLNEINRMPQVLAAGRMLGTQFNAHVSGLYVVPAAQIYPGMGYVTVPDLIDANQLYYRDKQAGAKQAFEGAMTADGLSFDFHSVESRLPQIGMDVAALGRSADLIVISATDRDAAQGVEPDFAERLIIAAGRPVLILPFLGAAKPDFGEVLVGWDGGREAARAVHDALPLLKMARRARLVSIDEGMRGEIQGAVIAEALARHGVVTELTTVSSDGQRTGEAILRAARDYGAGLIVLGGYGHSRFTEFVFGGVTRHVLRNLDRPVLMSH